MLDIVNTIITNESPLVKLLGDFDSSFVGYVYGTSLGRCIAISKAMLSIGSPCGGNA